MTCFAKDITMTKEEIHSLLNLLNTADKNNIVLAVEIIDGLSVQEFEEICKEVKPYFYNVSRTESLYVSFHGGAYLTLYNMPITNFDVGKHKGIKFYHNCVQSIDGKFNAIDTYYFGKGNYDVLKAIQDYLTTFKFYDAS